MRTCAECSSRVQQLRPGPGSKSLKFFYFNLVNMKRFLISGYGRVVILLQKSVIRIHSVINYLSILFPIYSKKK